MQDIYDDGYIYDCLCYEDKNNIHEFNFTSNFINYKYTLPFYTEPMTFEYISNNVTGEIDYIEKYKITHKDEF
jgi:hypothetical protein